MYCIRRQFSCSLESGRLDDEPKNLLKSQVCELGDVAVYRTNIFWANLVRFEYLQLHAAVDLDNL